MNASGLLHELNAAGVIVTLHPTDPTRLDVAGPGGTLTPDLLGRIKANKADLLATIANEYAATLLDLLGVREPHRAADLRHEWEERVGIVEDSDDSRHLAERVALDDLKANLPLTAASGTPDDAAKFGTLSANSIAK